ncbi:unnamed protein product, partial [marine sediment metagenome]
LLLSLLLVSLIPFPFVNDYKLVYKKGGNEIYENV